MDCRGSLVLTWGLLVAVGGCAHNKAAEQPLVKSDAPPANAEIHKAEDLPKRKPHPATLVSFGDVYVRGANEPWRGPSDKEQMLDQARKSYQQAIKIDPKYVPAHLALARLYDVTEDHDRAVASYRKALELKPKDAGLWYDLGMCHARKKEWEKAIEGLSKATDLDPENKPYARSLGFCLARAGYVNEGFTALCRVEGEAQAHYNLARMLHHVQQDELSKQHLRLALKTNPQLDEAQKLLAELETGAAPANPEVPQPAAPAATTVRGSSRS
jgi:tetratricopeptide (TPR) repeat protein